MGMPPPVATVYCCVCFLARGRRGGVYVGFGIRREGYPNGWGYRVVGEVVWGFTLWSVWQKHAKKRIAAVGGVHSGEMFAGGMFHRSTKNENSCGWGYPFEGIKRRKVATAGRH